MTGLDFKKILELSKILFGILAWYLTIKVVIPPNLGKQKTDFTHNSGLEKCHPTH